MTTFRPAKPPLKSYVRFYSVKYFCLCEPCALTLYKEGTYVARGTLNTVENRKCNRCGHSILRTIAV